MASPVPIARRIFLAGSAAMLCASCGDTWVDDMTSAARTYLMKGDDLHLTRADITRIPYASIAVRLGDGPQALLILARFDGDDLHWVSAQREVIVTRRGRVVETYGLPIDLKRTQFLTNDPVGRPARTMEADIECLRTIDLEPQHVDGILIRSRFAGGGSEDLAILGDHRKTSAWTETNAAPDLAWNFKNQYWSDARSGFVWRSLQYLSPQLPVLEIIVYKPPITA